MRASICWPCSCRKIRHFVFSATESPVAQQQWRSESCCGKYYAEVKSETVFPRELEWNLGVYTYSCVRTYTCHASAHASGGVGNDEARGWSNHGSCVGHKYDISRVWVAVNQHQASQCQVTVDLWALLQCCKRMWKKEDSHFILARISSLV